MHLITPVEEIVKSFIQFADGFTIEIKLTGSSHLKLVETVTEVFSLEVVDEHMLAVTVSAPVESS